MISSPLVARALFNKDDDFLLNTFLIIFLCIAIILMVTTLKLFTTLKRLKEKGRKIDIYNAKLAVERNKFLETLISIGDGVLVMDMDGSITMLNKVAEKLTGWTTAEAQGRHYKEVFILSHEDERLTIADPIEGVLRTDEVQILGDNAILTSRDGTKHYLEDSAAPIKDDKNNTIGVVLIFRDVTEKKRQLSKIEYLSFHDALTGLYNRMFFQEELNRLDTERNLPFSIIVGDINGLKLTNDIFGHDAGDTLIKATAEVMKRVCRADDIIARVGGDEFTILLPKTDEKSAEGIISRIKAGLAKENVLAVKGSISMGCSSKDRVEQDILQVLKSAEDNMYAVKTLDRNEMKCSSMKTIIDTLHRKSPGEEEHSKNIGKICSEVCKAMQLSENDIKRARDAGYYHDIGKIVLDEALLNKRGPLSIQEQKEMEQHPVVGYRILNSFDDTLDLAEAILAHHERWDGTGYPKGLKGEEIPVLARLIAIAESYEAMTCSANSEALNKEEAVIELKKQANTAFDPKAVDIFCRLI